MKNIEDIFFNYYNIPSGFNNDRSAIMSRIDDVERKEPRRLFFNEF